MNRSWVNTVCNEPERKKQENRSREGGGNQRGWKSMVTSPDLPSHSKHLAFSLPYSRPRSLSVSLHLTHRILCSKALGVRMSITRFDLFVHNFIIAICSSWCITDSGSLKCVVSDWNDQITLFWSSVNQVIGSSTDIPDGFCLANDEQRFELCTVDRLDSSVRMAY